MRDDDDFAGVRYGSEFNMTAYQRDDSDDIAIIDEHMCAYLLTDLYNLEFGLDESMVDDLLSSDVSDGKRAIVEKLLSSLEKKYEVIRCEWTRNSGSLLPMTDADRRWLEEQKQLFAEEK